MRELTEWDRAALARRYDSSSTHQLREAADGSVEVVERELRQQKAIRRKTFLAKPLFWAGLIMSISIGLTILILYAIWRIESLLGPGTLEYLSEQPMGPDVQAASEEAGFGWLPDMVQLYSMRFMLISLIMGFGIFVSAILVGIDVKINKKTDSIERKKLIAAYEAQMIADREVGIATTEEELEDIYALDEDEVDTVTNEDEAELQEEERE